MTLIISRREGGREKFIAFSTTYPNKKLKQKQPTEEDKDGNFEIKVLSQGHEPGFDSRSLKQKICWF